MTEKKYKDVTPRSISEAARQDFWASFFGSGANIQKFVSTRGFYDDSLKGILKHFEAIIILCSCSAENDYAKVILEKFTEENKKFEYNNLNGTIKIEEGKRIIYFKRREGFEPWGFLNQQFIILDTIKNETYTRLSSWMPIFGKPKPYGLLHPVIKAEILCRKYQNAALKIKNDIMETYLL